MKPIQAFLLTAALALPTAAAYKVLEPAAMPAIDPTDAYVTAPQEEQPKSEPQQKTGGLSGLFKKLKSIPKVEMTVRERQALDRMISVMPELSGGDGLFNQGDVEAIVASVRPGLAKRVDEEIAKRSEQTASQVSVPILPGLQRTVRGWLVDANVWWNRETYQSRGLERAEEIVRGGLTKGLTRSGVESGDEDGAPRSLTLSQLEQYAADGAIVAEYGERARAQGVPKISFPSGLGAVDLQAIGKQRKPPNGHVHLFGD